MNTIKEEIKKRIDIVTYIGGFVALKKAGRNFKGNCPFHKEKTPSFVVSPDRQIWHCFGSCGDGGDVITFLMKWENLTYVEAIREFAGELGIEINTTASDASSKLRERIIAINTAAIQFFHYLLMQSPVGKKAREYLKERGIRNEIINKFELGYAPSSWDSLTRFLTAKSFSTKELIDSGLAIKSDRGSIYDRFRGRLMFPLKDARGTPIGFSGRLLEGDAKAAKYVNTPETLVYHKRETLYGIHIAKEGIKNQKAAILVEGEFDMITPYQSGIDNIVAIKGSAVTKEQLMLIKRYTNRVYLALDADAAGAEAIKRGIEEAENLEFELGVVVFKEGKDPDEAARKDPVSFKKAISQPVPVYDYIIDYYCKKFPGEDAFSKKNIGESVGPFLAYIKNPIVESYYVRKMAALLGVDEMSVRQLMRRQQARKTITSRTFTKTTSATKEDRYDKMQRHLLSLLLQSDSKQSILIKITSIISPGAFSFPAYKQIYELLIQNQGLFTQKDSYIGLILDKAESELKNLIDELYLFASVDSEMGMVSFEKIAFEIKEYSLKDELKKLLALPQSDETEVRLAQVSGELKELEKTAGKIYNT